MYRAAHCIGNQFGDAWNCPPAGRFQCLRGHLSKQFGASMLPGSLVAAFGYSLPWVEAALGILVLFGIFTRPALVAGGLLIAVLSFGSGLIQDWNP